MTYSLAPFIETTHGLGTSHRHGLRSDVSFDDPFDVVVIGSGAGGAVAAETLVCAGLRALLLEGGGNLKADAANAAVDAAAPPKHWPVAISEGGPHRAGQGAPPQPMAA